MVGSKNPSLEFVRATVAVHSLDDCDWFYGARSGGSVFPRSQREAAFSCDIAGSCFSCCLLAAAFVSARNVFPPLRKLQQDLRNVGCRHRPDDMAVLDG